MRSTAHQKCNGVLLLETNAAQRCPSAPTLPLSPVSSANPYNHTWCFQTKFSSSHPRDAARCLRKRGGKFGGYHRLRDGPHQRQKKKTQQSQQRPASGDYWLDAERTAAHTVEDEQYQWLCVTKAAKQQINEHSTGRGSNKNGEKIVNRHVGQVVLSVRSSKLMH